tara:strand:- start:1735 stop:1941 length:207 start_codon:yes stop_codon:yes gene_type:complete
MINYKKKYLKYKSKYLQLNNILGGKKNQYKTTQHKSKPTIKFEKLYDYFISIRNKKIIKDIKKLQQKS